MLVSNDSLHIPGPTGKEGATRKGIHVALPATVLDVIGRIDSVQHRTRCGTAGGKGIERSLRVRRIEGRGKRSTVRQGVCQRV